MILIYKREISCSSQTVTDGHSHKAVVILAKA